MNFKNYILLGLVPSFLGCATVLHRNNDCYLEARVVDTNSEPVNVLRREAIRQRGLGLNSTNIVVEIDNHLYGFTFGRTYENKPRSKHTERIYDALAGAQRGEERTIGCSDFEEAQYDHLDGLLVKSISVK